MPVIARIHRSNSIIFSIGVIIPEYRCTVYITEVYYRFTATTCVVVNIILWYRSLTTLYREISRVQPTPNFWMRHSRRCSCEPSFTDITVYRPIPVPILLSPQYRYPISIPYSYYTLYLYYYYLYLGDENVGNRCTGNFSRFPS